MPAIIATSTIVAQAWRFMELAPISSFDDDTEQARAAAEQYPDALRLCLLEADFGFASSLFNLPEAELPSTVAADPDLPYFYQPGGDTLRIHEVGDEYTRWRTDLDGLRADTPGPLRVRATVMITNEDILPATFKIAVALSLANLLAPRWLGTQSKIDALERRYQIAIAKAKKQDARSASEARYDGLTEQGDWATDATL